MKKKEIKINKNYLNNLALSLLLGFSILYILEHKGNLTYNYDESTNSYHSEELTWTQKVSLDSKITHFTFQTFFDNKLEFPGNEFTVGDLVDSESNFNDYTTKSYYYTQAIIKDFWYGITISLTIFAIIIFLKNFKIKVTS